MASRDSSVCRAGSGLAIPHDVADDAVLDQLDFLLRRPFEVEGLLEVALVERVVVERDLRIESLLADPSAEVAALLEKPLRAERVVREPADQLGDCVRAQDSAVAAGLELPG